MSYLCEGQGQHTGCSQGKNETGSGKSGGNSPPAQFRCEHRKDHSTILNVEIRERLELIVCVCVCMHTCVSTWQCMQRPEEDFGYLTLLISILFIELGANLATSKALGILFSCLLPTGLDLQAAQSQLFLCLLEIWTQSLILGSKRSFP